MSDFDVVEKAELPSSNPRKSMPPPPSDVLDSFDFDSFLNNNGHPRMPSDLPDEMADPWGAWGNVTTKKEKKRWKSSVNLYHAPALPREDSIPIPVKHEPTNAGSAANVSMPNGTAAKVEPAKSHLVGVTCAKQLPDQEQKKVLEQEQKRTIELLTERIRKLEAQASESPKPAIPPPTGNGTTPVVLDPFPKRSSSISAPPKADKKSSEDPIWIDVPPPPKPNTFTRLPLAPAPALPFNSFTYPPPPPLPPPPPVIEVAPSKPRKARKDYDSDRSRSRNRLPTAHSHEDILPEDDECGFMDKLVLLRPFSRKVYVSYHYPSATDFSSHLWLLRFAQPERWYSWPSASQLRVLDDWSLLRRSITTTAPDGFGAQKMPQQGVHEALPLVERAQPQTLAYPRINAGRALVFSDQVAPWCECEQRLTPTPTPGANGACVGPSECLDPRCGCRMPGKGYPCAECREERRLPLSDERALTYYSVVQSYQGHAPYRGDVFVVPAPGDDKGIEAGLPIYKVVRTGSRQAAAAQAFYDAGANGWSTVFVCAVREGQDVGSMCDEYGHLGMAKHAESMDELVAVESYRKGWWPVLY
ncbi:hypothetical protein H2203_007673 [Taxawa tesnikishii (nom. ined.)]|nr:hypothetical protein H2203_007673 [Dothideales sp. JES 119]